MNRLEPIIRAQIAAQGPLTMAAYMELALQHPEHGYYRVRKPVGRVGDFITAPEVSQMFGEMIGVWAAEAWRNLGKPPAFALLELGPGRGTMMADLLRATARVPGFAEAKRLYLLESDAALRDEQKTRLSGYTPTYIAALDDLPDLPLIVVANEFFDALPVRQFEQTFRGWAERCVGVENDKLARVLRPLTEAELPLVPEPLRNHAPGTVAEVSPQAQHFARDLAARLKRKGGIALIIDYGYVAPPLAPTIQAVSRHAFADILAAPGEIDLTAHVDFAALAAAAHAADAVTTQVMGQGEFLKMLGIELRAETLKLRATPEQAADIDIALARLLSPDRMGQLFKVMEIRG